MSLTYINLAYLVAAILFIFGLIGLTHPRTAVRGNLLGACGMLLAVVATLLDQHVLSFAWIVVGGAVGAAIGAIMALKVQMTGMPQMVALLNGFGGIASLLVAGAALWESQSGGSGEAVDLLGVTAGELQKGPDLQMLIATAASGLIGSVTFSGSLIAFAKLQELWKSDLLLPARNLIVAAIMAAAVFLAVLLVQNPDASWPYWLLVLVSLVLGVLLTVPIGGADMPVVIALLNSYSGLAAAATGFVLTNNVLIIAGSLVGASGIILTSIMCKAMNRSLTNVLFGVLQPAEGGATADEVYTNVKSTSAEEVAMLFDTARRVMIVPGYGMAVSQAQHAVRDLANLLESKDIEVLFAIHPVAGRMPGHMNVLLAEADVPYDKLLEMDSANPMMPETDVTIVIGANDVVNPLARTDPSSPIAGMPIIDVDKSQTVIVIKRSLSPGFAGIPNPLFNQDNTLMYFGDGKKAFLDLITAVKEG